MAFCQRRRRLLDFGTIVGRNRGAVSNYRGAILPLKLTLLCSYIVFLYYRSVDRGPGFNNHCATGFLFGGSVMKAKLFPLVLLVASAFLYVFGSAPAQAYTIFAMTFDEFGNCTVTFGTC